MAPVIADGGYVAYSDAEEDLDSLNHSLVVAWIEGQTLIRWFSRSGRFGVLRAENPAHESATLLFNVDESAHDRKIRRVLWISTPH